MLKFQNGGFLMKYIDFLKQPIIFIKFYHFLQSLKMFNELQMHIKTLTHDYYILDLPDDQQHQFYNQFAGYRNNFSYRCQKISQVPIVRIYGTNQYGQKCCCHIHGFMPSFYIKIQDIAEQLNKQDNLSHFLSQMEELFRNCYKIQKPIIYRAQIQNKYDFYGFHTKKSAFLKVWVFDPIYVMKMMDLLAQGILNNRFYQCYQAHINYFMQMFTDLNIFGIHQMHICGLTFRKNLQNMQIFQKIHSSLTKKILNKGWNLSTLYLQHKEYFNLLYKNSTCYLQFDLHYENILNAYEQNQSKSEFIMHSSDEQEISEKMEKKLKVQVIKALEEIWKDEEKRRTMYKIKQKLEGIIDYSKNIQSESSVQLGISDPLWINFYQKGSNKKDFLQMLQSYSNNQPIKQNTSDFLKVKFNFVENYTQLMQNQNQKLIQKVHDRWKFYDFRKNKIINEILQGQRQQLPVWNEQLQHEQRNNSEEQFNQQDEKEHQITMDFEQTKRKNITAIYRNNYKYKRGEINQSGFFNHCLWCNQKIYDCYCYICEECGEKNCYKHCLKTQIEEKQELQQQQSIKVQQYNQQEFLIQNYEYNKNIPTINAVMSSIKIGVQKPYFSKITDLFQHYKISNYYPKELKVAQYLDKELKYSKLYEREPISIQNELKLPYFYKIYQPPFTEQIEPKTYQLQYCLPPPSKIQIENVDQRTKQITIQNSLKIEEIQKQMQFKKNNEQINTFSSDLLIFNYQFLFSFSQQIQQSYYGNPQQNQISAIIFNVCNYNNFTNPIYGLILTQNDLHSKLQLHPYHEIFLVSNEYDLISLFICLIIKIDVDILVSYDQQKHGIRYLLQRASNYNLNISKLLSRSVDLEEVFQFLNFNSFIALKQTYLWKEFIIHGNVKEKVNKDNSNKNNTYYMEFLNNKLKERINKKPILRKKYHFQIQIKGRVNINLCRICEQSLKMKSYTIEAVIKKIFNKQLCEYTDSKLWQMYGKNINYVLNYLKTRVQFTHRILEQLNIISSIVEKSKVYGADFVSMMERGSQFKIESIMCRVTKQNNFLTLSASKIQVANQSILECRPMVLEPPKQFYSQPVLLFDFQSLYPSVMIAYNICYSTCLGSLNSHFKKGRVKKMGVSDSVDIDIDNFIDILDNNSENQALKILQKYIFITPNRIAFVKKNLKQGFIPKILLQFLLSRIMIKNSIKLYKKQGIKKLLKQRQIALKLFMNVMFGYTGASFTGRMPCSEIADSVVQIAKYCLRKSIDFLNQHKQFKGKVIYGDTDSIFLHLPEQRLCDTFKIGQQIAAQITKMFPYPIQMKFQKVYENLLLVAKKRYYGKSYENSNTQPKYEGKGLQCVRRDGIDLTSNFMQTILNKLINCKDLSAIKKMFNQMCSNLLDGKIFQDDLTLAKQVKLLKYTDKSCPAHGQAAKKLEKIDKMLVPKYGERMKYLVTEQSAKTIKKKSMSVFQFIKRSENMDYQYYCERMFIPPLKRTLISLVNIDQWQSKSQKTQKTFQQSDFKYLRQNSQEYQYCHHSNKEQKICLQCLNQYKTQKNHQYVSYLQDCKQCAENKNDFDVEQCVEFNCKILYRRRRSKIAQEQIGQFVNEVQQSYSKIKKYEQKILEKF